jgi:hypothetical protein
MNIADKIFEGERTRLELEDNLLDIGVQFESTGFDSYDNSFELFDVPDDYRLSAEAQEILFKAGFSVVYLNHKNKWETHYKFGSEPLKEVEGWRVSYPQNRGKGEKGIWVENKIDSWPKEWFETGYAVVKDKGECSV